VGRDSVLSIASHLGLDGTEIESLWGWSFPHPSRLTLRPNQPPIQGIPGLSVGKQPGRGDDHPLHLAPRLKEEYSYTSTHTLGLHGMLKCELYLLPL